MFRYPAISIPPIYLHDWLPNPWPVCRKAYGMVMYVDLHIAIIKAVETLPENGEREEFYNYCLCHASWTTIDEKDVQFMNEKFGKGEVVGFTFEIFEVPTRERPLHCIVYDVMMKPPEFQSKAAKRKPKKKAKAQTATEVVTESADDSSMSVFERKDRPDFNLFEEVMSSVNKSWLGRNLRHILEPSMVPTTCPHRELFTNEITPEVPDCPYLHRKMEGNQKEEAAAIFSKLSYSGREIVQQRCPYFQEISVVPRREQAATTSSELEVPKEQAAAIFSEPEKEGALAAAPTPEVAKLADSVSVLSLNISTPPQSQSITAAAAASSDFKKPAPPESDQPSVSSSPTKLQSVPHPIGARPKIKKKKR